MLTHCPIPALQAEQKYLVSLNLIKNMRMGIQTGELTEQQVANPGIIGAFNRLHRYPLFRRDPMGNIFYYGNNDEQKVEGDLFVMLQDTNGFQVTDLVWPSGLVFHSLLVQTAPW